MTELIIAISVVGFALIPVMTVLFTSDRGVADVERQAMAFGLATEAMEWARALPVERLVDAASGSSPSALTWPGARSVQGETLRFLEEAVKSFVDDAGKEHVYPEALGQFRRETVFTLIGEAPRYEGARVEVTLAWTLPVRGSPRRRLVLESFLWMPARRT